MRVRILFVLCIYMFCFSWWYFVPSLPPAKGGAVRLADSCGAERVRKEQGDLDVWFSTRERDFVVFFWCVGITGGESAVYHEQRNGKTLMNSHVRGR